MTSDALEAQPATKRLRQVVLELSLVSQVRGMSYDKSGGASTDSTSGSVPPGGTDRKGDREEAYRQKTADCFLRRYAGLLRQLHRISDVRAESTRDEILNDARVALNDWRKTPTVPGRDPDWGTFQWKKRVANDERPSRIVAGFHGISHVTVLRYRRDYAGV